MRHRVVEWSNHYSHFSVTLQVISTIAFSATLFMAFNMLCGSGWTYLVIRCRSLLLPKFHQIIMWKESMCTEEHSSREELCNFNLNDLSET